MEGMLREFTYPNITVINDADTIYSFLRRRVANNPDGPLAAYKEGTHKAWTYVSATEMNQRVLQTARGLLALGVKKGDKVIIYAPTSYQWGIADFACAAIGAISVPIYDTDSAGQVSNIVREVKPTIAFTAGDKRAQILETLKASSATTVTYVFNFEKDGLEALKDWGANVSEDRLNAAIDQVRSHDPATIVYTSGSTGRPKGAVLSNSNFAHIVINGPNILPTMLNADNTRLLLFLPLAHCFARYIQYSTFYSDKGVVAYQADAKHLLTDMRSFKPSYLLGVPRVFEKVYNAASQKAGAGLTGHIFARAVKHFTQWSKDEEAGLRHSLKDKIAHAFFERSVGESIRSALGGDLHFLACGGAPMNIDLAHFFHGIDGITFIQGYGMTETAAPCVINSEIHNRVGSAGMPAPGFSVRLAADDELEIKGPSVFSGYYNDPARTDDAFDGPDHLWVKTGDLAQIDDDGFIYIIGRKKDIIITAGGKNVSPAPMEDTIKTCPIVSQAVVIGDGRPFISALITLDKDMLSAWLSSQGRDSSVTMEEACKDDSVRSFVQEYVDQANATVSRAESVRKFIIIPDDFSQKDKTMTPSMKVVRKAILKKYENLINTDMYAPKPSTMPKAPTVRIMEAADTVSESTQRSLKQAQKKIDPVINKAQEKIDPMLTKAKDAINDSVGKYVRISKDEAEPKEDPASQDQDKQDKGKQDKTDAQSADTAAAEILTESDSAASSQAGSSVSSDSSAS